MKSVKYKEYFFRKDEAESKICLVIIESLLLV